MACRRRTSITIGELVGHSSWRSFSGPETLDNRDADTMTVMNEEDLLPDLDFAKEFYAKYEIKEVLGRGVSSTVRRCIEKDTQTEFAVKIIDLTQEKDNEFQMEEFRSATRKEMNILRMCAQHPHIIELHDTFESSTFIFLVFEICKKGELFDYLTEVVTLSEKRTRQIMRQLLDAIEFIHDKQIVHRDLKPENILLDDNLNVKLSDFGFASVINHEDELQDLCGTPGYLAPEVLKVSMYEDAPGYGRPVDMWAIGVIMYTLLVGCPPFWHRKQMYMLRAIMDGRYCFSNPEWEDISEAPKDLISHLLVVDPVKRYTAKDALAHPFFSREEVSVPGSVPPCDTVLSPSSPPVVAKQQREEKKIFYAKRMFKAAVFCVLAMRRIRLLHLNPPPIMVQDVRRDPYSVKPFRKIIDAGAFRIYGHWVKKGENQNRAALFENRPKRDLKSAASEKNVDPSTIFAPQVEVRGRVGSNVPTFQIGSPNSLDDSSGRPIKNLRAPRLGEIRKTSNNR
ncbi:hypothetical protein CAPTEDRAFT_148295 [Capitella teleta]|uniref:phosphorylase kinase n=1 Tax=Capitella teleta TaxID=283909 RepID=R7TDR3_CAPTE|nr:hypothetical protein CAPTEDRAFT_148295 [Capitella teleta]|eukprot:ELT91652.1 hypothetical protein CAPTEDRAFT_148295 [Capitella teleta]